MTRPEKSREEESADRPVQQEPGTGQPAEEWGERRATSEQIASGGKQTEQTAPPEQRPGT